MIVVAPARVSCRRKNGLLIPTTVAERALHADFAHAGQRVEIGHGRNALIDDWQRAALLGFGAQTVHHRAFQRLPRLLAELRLVPPVATKLHLLTRGE